MGLKLSKKQHHDPVDLMDIINEAYDLVENRIDYLRGLRLHEAPPHIWEFSFLKELRDLLKMSENFRDD